jgi:hypothetical protein
MIKQQAANVIGEQLRSIVDQQEWTGTLSELVLRLQQPPSEMRFPVRLGRWLRRNEPTLWWDYGVGIHFSRTKDRRRIRLVRAQST